MSKSSHSSKSKDETILLVNEIADKVWSELSIADKDKLKNIKSSSLHFTLGIKIRNMYIHNDGRCKDIDPDNLSGAVIGKLIRRAKGIDENVSIIELIMFT